MRSKSDPPYRRKSIYTDAHEYDRRMIIVPPSLLLTKTTLGSGFKIFLASTFLEGKC